MKLILFVTECVERWRDVGLPEITGEKLKTRGLLYSPDKWEMAAGDTSGGGPGGITSAPTGTIELYGVRLKPGTHMEITLPIGAMAEGD